jgi:hypothetical protein
MNLKRVVLVVMLCLLAVVGLPGGLPKTALACSGTPMTFKESYDTSDIFVKATVVEPDDLGQNAIVRVERYYKGGAGPEYVLLERKSLETIIGLGAGYLGGGDCNSWAEPIQRGDVIYFMASRTYTGAYFSSNVFAQEYFIYRNADNVADIFLNHGAPESFTESQFLKYIKEQVGDAFVVPDSKHPYPRKAPLLVTTKDQKRYILPVDDETLLNLETYIEQMSEDRRSYYSLRFRSFGRGKERCLGLNCKAFFVSGDMYYYESILDSCGTGGGYQAALFSPMGNYVVWSEGKIFFNCKQALLTTLNTDNKNSAEALAIYAQWSSDGRILAYNDLKGLWLWDERGNEENPRLLIPIEKGTAYARYFSPRNGYLAITWNGKPSTINLQTGVIFIDGLFSPNEEYFLAFGTPDPNTGAFPVFPCKLPPAFEGYAYDRCDMDKLSSNSKTLLPDTEVPIYADLGRVKQIEWIGEFALRALVHPHPFPYHEKDGLKPETYWDAQKQGFVLIDYRMGFDPTPTIYPNYILDLQVDGTYKQADKVISGFEFVYDHGNKSLALRQNDTTIFIDNTSYDFSKQLSSPIVQIDWLPSLMYRDRAR